MSSLPIFHKAKSFMENVQGHLTHLKDDLKLWEERLREAGEELSRQAAEAPVEERVYSPSSGRNGLRAGPGPRRLNKRLYGRIQRGSTQS